MFSLAVEAVVVYGALMVVDSTPCANADEREFESHGKRILKKGSHDFHVPSSILRSLPFGSISLSVFSLSPSPRLTKTTALANQPKSFARRTPVGRVLLVALSSQPNTYH